MVADKKKSAVQRYLLHALGVKTHTADKDEVPCRTDQEPPVKSAVLVVKLLCINETGAYEKECPVRQKQRYKNNDQPKQIFHLRPYLIK